MPWVETLDKGQSMWFSGIDVFVAILLAWLALRVFRMAMRLVFLALAVAMFTAVYYMFKKSKR